MIELLEPPIVTPDRRSFIGGSDISAILGISPWKSMVDLWIDKISPPVESTQNIAAKRRGTRLEPYILDMIREDYGLEIVAHNVRYVDSSIPFFAAEIDAETEKENIEIKTVHPLKVKEWGDLDTDQLPLFYLAQVQWGLGVRPKPRTLTFALLGDELKRYVVERDDETIAAMRMRAMDFWHTYVLALKQPPMDYEHKDVLETLKRLYPGTDGTVIAATGEDLHWRSVYETSRAQASSYQSMVDGAKAHLLAQMGQATAIRFDDGKAFTRKVVQRKGYVVEPSTYTDFRLCNFKE